MLMLFMTAIVAMFHQQDQDKTIKHSCDIQISDVLEKNFSVFISEP